MWQWLSGQYQEAHNPDWTFPENLKGQTAFQALSHVTTEYEHSIAVDIGVCECVCVCVCVRACVRAGVQRRPGDRCSSLRFIEEVINIRIKSCVTILIF